MNNGQIVKKIRIGKGYTQSDVSKNICTQGTYSKYENEEITDIKVDLMSQILDRLEISYEEFFYIKNDYSMSLHEKIIHNFYNQSYNNLNNLLQLKKDCLTYLNDFPNDELIININTALEGLIFLSETEDFEGARKIVKPIWTNLSNRGDLFMADIYLLNSILFIFPLSTAKNMKLFAFRQIEKYGYFKKIYRLKINFLMNLTLLLIGENEFKEALDHIEESITICLNEQQFINLAICYIRKGICLKYLYKNDENFIKKGLSILEVLEQKSLINMIKSEFNNEPYL